MSFFQIDKEIARILAPIAHNLEVSEALAEYAKFKIKQLNEQFHHVDATNSAEIGKIQGQYMELKALMTLRNDVNQIVRGAS